MQFVQYNKHKKNRFVRYQQTLIIFFFLPQGKTVSKHPTVYKSLFIIALCCLFPKSFCLSGLRARWLTAFSWFNNMHVCTGAVRCTEVTTHNSLITLVRMGQMKGQSNALFRVRHSWADHPDSDKKVHHVVLSQPPSTLKILYPVILFVHT